MSEDKEDDAKKRQQRRYAVAIMAARAVAATDEAQKVARRSKGKLGVWGPDDEKLLKKGRVRTPGGDLFLPVKGGPKWAGLEKL